MEDSSDAQMRRWLADGEEGKEEEEEAGFSPDYNLKRLLIWNKITNLFSWNDKLIRNGSS